MAKAKREKTPVVTATRTKSGWDVTARAGKKKSTPRAEATETDEAVEAALEALDEVSEDEPKKE